ncbi:hypothetical protein [Tumebacillus lipolyticus]|uniref:Uncharacterized protein n=1 Tax=Tumebacillus lipolyticus TaxID=1280370 RepID=A0ABW4ZWP6_9BACL
MKRRLLLGIVIVVTCAVLGYTTGDREENATFVPPFPVGKNIIDPTKF